MGQAKRAQGKLELVYADICGPMRTESLAGSKYFLLIIDDFSRMSWAYFNTFKSEAFECFKKFKAQVEKQCNQKLKSLRTDRGENSFPKISIFFMKNKELEENLLLPIPPNKMV